MIIAGIVAGGVGSRLDSNIPKQYLPLNDIPLVAYTAKKFLDSPNVDYVIIGVNKFRVSYIEEIISKYLDDERVFVAIGGNTRNSTVISIVELAKHICKSDSDIILTHDAVRPFVNERIIEDNIAMVKRFGFCTTAINSVDTIALVTKNIIDDVPLRSKIYALQTPQSFTLGAFKDAMTKVTLQDIENATDMSKIFHLGGYKPAIVDGSVLNFKITYDIEYRMAQMIIEQRGEDDYD